MNAFRSRLLSQATRSPTYSASTFRLSTPFIQTFRTSIQARASNAESAAAASPTNGTSSSTPSGASLPTASRLKDGMNDLPLEPDELTTLGNNNGQNGGTDWSRSFHGLSSEPFSKEIADVLLGPLKSDDVEIKPDGIIYLPEIKYRRILNKAFGPGGWGLAPRGETIVTEKAGGGGLVTREYALVCHGRLISVARGEQDYFDDSGIPTAMEGCKSNAIMRCCKDLGVASELWDPRFIRKFKKEYCTEQFGEHAVTKRKKKLWLRKGDSLEYPYVASKYGS